MVVFEKFWLQTRKSYSIVSILSLYGNNRTRTRQRLRANL